MIYRDLTEMIGNTPLMEAVHLEGKYDLKARLLVKLECFNPAGSAKDRVALSMIRDGEEKGILKKGATIIEPTSGNTGIGLAAVAVARGYRAILTMPDTMSVERQNLLKAFGAELVLTEGSKGMAGAVEKAEELSKEIPNSFIPGQFENPANPRAHYETTGPEIWRDTEGKIDIFVATIGTGGTVSGAGKYLKEQNPNIKIYGIEPFSSPLITKGVAGPHKIQGIGANFIPDTYDRTICDNVFTVTDEDAFSRGKEFARTEGILVGISSGACLQAAINLAGKEENKGKTIVALLTDTGERYLSTPMYK